MEGAGNGFIPRRKLRYQISVCMIPNFVFTRGIDATSSNSESIFSHASTIPNSKRTTSVFTTQFRPECTPPNPILGSVLSCSAASYGCIFAKRLFGTCIGGVRLSSYVPPQPGITLSSAFTNGSSKYSLSRQYPIIRIHMHSKSADPAFDVTQRLAHGTVVH
ncbi:hypothetical protein P152DRAFT_33202 [Eremomyces bilateralis CBS 781.70]|uniref:Uncharacterized protein n=1 Tax=Eremomyces bilateralis CBS 781.70 TaxID=1392243 RepID=A0A6G1G2K7_9PEZI|nr:uncharacterized protein P152DRAFT_33202 [Eremomyces bilateralis CBS 781.70]KAF1812347.1 hypothetical protein P152DRAFT_33202 [Eremomyces bilateralis CBS 781.70]